MITAKLLGAKELEASLVELAKLYGPKTVRNIFNPPLRKASAAILQDIKTNTPVSSGSLRDSVAMKVGRPNKVRLRSDAVDEYTVAESRIGWFWRRGDRVSSYQALAIEFGTLNQPAQPVLRKALQNGASRAVKILQLEIGKSIKQTAKRLAKKRLKGLI